MFLDPVGIQAPAGPSVDEVPAGAWIALSDTIQRALDDPDVASSAFEMGPGRFTLEQGVATFAMGDVLVHAWDLARATGLDETLDPDEVHRLWVGMSEMDEAVLRNSGHFGPRVDVPDDAGRADEADRLHGPTAVDGRRLSRRSPRRAAPSSGAPGGLRAS